MAVQGVVFDKMLLEAQDDAQFYYELAGRRNFVSQYIPTSLELTANGMNVNIGIGRCMIYGRWCRVTTVTTIPIQPTTSGYIVLTIDLTQTNTWTGDIGAGTYSATNNQLYARAVQSLTQQDLNNGGFIYDYVLGTYSATTTTVTPTFTAERSSLIDNAQRPKITRETGQILHVVNSGSFEDFLKSLPIGLFSVQIGSGVSQTPSASYGVLRGTIHKTAINDSSYDYGINIVHLVDTLNTRKGWYGHFYGVVGSVNNTMWDRAELAYKYNVDLELAKKLNLTGGTVTGNITLNATPTASAHLARIQDVNAKGTEVLNTVTNQFQQFQMINGNGTAKVSVGSGTSITTAFNNMATGSYTAYVASDASGNTTARTLIGWLQKPFSTANTWTFIGMDYFSGRTFRFSNYNGTVGSWVELAHKDYVDTMMPKSGGTFTGNVLQPLDPLIGDHLANRRFVLDQTAKQLSLTGGTMSGQINQPLSPTSGNHLTNKNYVDGLTDGLFQYVSVAVNNAVVWKTAYQNSTGTTILANTGENGTPVVFTNSSITTRPLRVRIYFRHGQMIENDVTLYASSTFDFVASYVIDVNNVVHGGWMVSFNTAGRAVFYSTKNNPQNVYVIKIEVTV